MGRLAAWLSPPVPGTIPLFVATLISTLGIGQLAAGLVVHLVRYAGLPPSQAALCLTTAGAVGLFLGIPLGHLADRAGPRRIAVILLLIRAAATALLAVSSSIGALLPVVALIGAGERGSNAALASMVARVGGEERLRLRAYLRAVTNIGLTAGAAVAGFWLQADTRWAYQALVLGSALSIAGAAVALLPIAPLAPLPVPQGERRWQALRDKTYMAVTALHGVLSLHFDIITVGIPLWIVSSDTLPTWSISALLILNTVIVVLFQVRASRGGESVIGAGRLARRAGWTLLLGCVVIGLVEQAPGGPAVALLLVGGLILTVGELWQVSSSFALSFDLARDHAQGQYQAVFALGRGGAKAVAPVLLAYVCVDLGLIGWAALGICLALTGLALYAVTARLERRGTATGEPAVTIAAEPRTR